ncbi:DoxX-like family protein [Leptospira koniambonensis]|uniref:DoxX-like family protein n=1 Tax=Leptospira koniambonensis TaxID=2484950 RepID=UPI003EBDE0B8
MKRSASGNIFQIVTNLLIVSVWFVNGLVCKVLDLVPRHREIVARILGAEFSWILTKLIGVSEILMAIWILSGIRPVFNIWAQITIVMVMNVLEFFLVPDLLLWGRANILFASTFCIFVLYSHKNKS